MALHDVATSVGTHQSRPPVYSTFTVSHFLYPVIAF
jgi:hypothetical protein